MHSIENTENHKENMDSQSHSEAVMINILVHFFSRKFF